jgi:hypothetical protein
MALTPLKVGQGRGGFKEGKARWARYGFDSASSTCGDWRRRERRRPDSTAVRSDSSDVGGR